MTVIWNEWSGHLAPKMKSLHRTVGQYLRNGRHSHVMVGVTSNPERRWKERYRKEWDKMVVIYRTMSLEYATRCEREIVAHFGHSRAQFESSWNTNPGGNGNFRSYGPYFIYLVLSS
ncbi:MAG: hypothetical protein NVV74_05820 [Magnetospirillum sp.]|nr:hypothetical protein [Magnetospirillum sp.]